MRLPHAVVTGANRGIGLATALELARRGHDVVGTVRSPQKADDLFRAAAEARVKVSAALMDVTDIEGCRREMARLDVGVLVNNAGYTQFGAIEEIEDGRAAEQVDAMMLAPMRLARMVLPAMLEAGDGCIVNVSSVFGFVAMPYAGWYQASKHGLDAATHALRCEVSDRGVRVVTVQPGGVVTDIWEDHRTLPQRSAGSPHRRAYLRFQDFMRGYGRIMATPERVATVIANVVESKHPRWRYLAGADARVLIAIHTLLSQRWQDRIARWVWGI